MRFPFKNIFLSAFILLMTIALSKATPEVKDTTKTTKKVRLETASVEWIGQWPGISSNHKENKVKGKIQDYILGEKPNHTLIKPVSVTVNSQKAYWILDQGNNLIFQVDKDHAEVPGFIEKNKRKFSSLVSICNYLPEKSLFTDSYLNKIFIINEKSKVCKILNDSLVLEQPTGIAYSKIKNEIWVVETAAHRVSILNEQGQIIKRIGKRGNGRGEFNFPTHIWIDMDGNVYIIDSMNFRVQVFNKEGEIISVFGSNGNGTGSLARPKGIATDSYGNIYIADALFNVIQIFDINGQFLFTFGSQGREQGQFWMPSGIFIDDANKIYVADTYNSRIQIFQLVAGSKK